MNNAVGIGDLDKMLSELSPKEREQIAKMISDRFDEMQAAWNEGYCGYGRKSRTTLLPLRDNQQPREEE